MTNGSVWYSLTAFAAAHLVDVSQSDFSAGVIVATRPPGNLSLVTCGPRSVGFEATQGTTYYLLAGQHRQGAGGFPQPCAASSWAFGW